jgi:acetyl-CoA carboxylase biotin carboxylase subunit
MFGKVLIANRGEIACRIGRSVHALGARTVAVYSEADASAPHVVEADESYLIGPPPVAKSYLNVARILDVARAAGADAIHPGYGLLSENAEFAAACAEAGIVFIGPSPAAIEAMGNKLNGRRIMRDAGVPVVPGDTAPTGDIAAAIESAAELGYPVIVKASSGGGGIGMQVVDQAADLERGIESCRRLAGRNFGDDTVYIEKYIERPRHIEVQVLGDRYGTIVALGERECSIQRRHQKVIEEAPSPAVDAALRARLEDAAVRGARSIGYTNAGTLEFVMDERGCFFFMEMNTRLQVEHPVTEMTTGIDLVAEQLRIACGEPLSVPAGIVLRGHAIECRIYAEDPVRMLPSPGTVGEVRWPAFDGIRVDAGIRDGSVVTPFYDPLLAKVIAWGNDRSQSIERMRAALASIAITGLKTNIPLLAAILREPDFTAGVLDTHFISTHNVTAQTV